jgi:membrane protease YdiL (CAAX protease family)
MESGFFNSAGPFTKILLVLFLMVTCYLVLFGVGILLAWPVFGVPPSEAIALVESRDAGQYRAMMKFLQVLYSIGLFMAPALLAGFLIRKNPLDYLRANRRVNISMAGLVIVLMIVSIPWINYLGFLNEKLSLPDRWSEWMEQIRQSDESSWELMKSYLATDKVGGLLFNLFMIALVPAIGEEFLFRGILQRIFAEWFRNVHLAVWLAAILFSLAHYQFLGFIPRICLGALFGYIFAWTANIWIPVIAHLVNNAVGVIYYYLFLQGTIGSDPQQLGMQGNPFLFIMGSIGLTAIGMFVIRQAGKMSVDA